MAITKSINFLPNYLQTIANRKFLGSTLDLLINDPQLTRFDGYIGRTFYDGKLLDGNYLLESTPLRQHYQLEAAFVTQDDNQNVIETTNFIDLLNSCANKEAVTTAWNRLLTNNLYSWQGFVNLDKIINYANYCWISTNENDWYWNNSVKIYPSISVSQDILGQESYIDINEISLMDGMIVSFPNDSIYTSQYIVEGVGKEITLVPTSNIIIPDYSTAQNIPADYITIARNAIDLNSWSRSNLWIHKDTLSYILSTLSAQNVQVDTPDSFDVAERPIIEYTPLILYNSGKIGISTSTYFDNSTPDAFYIVQGKTNFEVDNYQLNTGDSVIFNADHDKNIRSNIYDINFIDTTRSEQLTRLYPVQAASLVNLSLYGLLTVDGYQTKAGDRILALGQADTDENGIYIVSKTSWSFASDYSSNNQFGVLILYGETLKNKYYVHTPAAIINNAVTGTLTSTANSYIYTVPFSLDPNSLLIWDNFPLIPSVGYTVSGTDIIFTQAPNANDALHYQGWYAGQSPTTQPTYGELIGTQDGINTSFYIQSPPDDATLIIWDNFPLIENVGYTRNGLEITFAKAPLADDSIFYQAWSEWDSSQPTPVIQLIIKDTAKDNNCSLVTSGDIYKNTMMFFCNGYWQKASVNKSAINQYPYFDVYDSNNISFGNTVTYANSSFTGSELFSYEEGTGDNDSILGFPLTYGDVGNLNDIIFNNDYNTDTFSDAASTSLANISLGNPHYIDPLNEEETSHEAWNYVTCNLELYQSFSETGNANISLVGTLLKKENISLQNQVFVDGTKLDTDEFSIAESNGNININITANVANTSVVLTKLLATAPISGAWYDIPPAFDHNPMGEDISAFNMADLRFHAQEITSRINGNPSIFNLFLSDFQNSYGSILHQEALSLLPSLLLCNSNFDIDRALRTAGEDYILFKQKFLNLAKSTKGISSMSTKDAVDTILQTIASSHNSSDPWYTSDMCAWGVTTTSYTISNVHQNSFNLTQSYDFSSANTQEILIYLNSNQLIIGQDYTVSGNQLAISTTLSIGDQISVHEISDTDGNYIPATPTKLGLARAYLPQIYTDYTYQTPKQVIQGHDGSIVTCYGDYRDQLILDYEKRVYNNLKVNNQLLFETIENHVPQGGRWRNENASSDITISPYSQSELLSIQQRMFYEWSADYNVTYTNSFYDADDSFTWNWSSCLDKLADKQPLLGYWRGIYRWFFDTDSPNTKPWEILGLSIKPNWWDKTYGPSPYTGGNNVLWNDIANGIIRDPSGSYQSVYGIRVFGNNSVTSVIPVDNTGNLLDPNDSVVGTLNLSKVQNDFSFGDDGPSENAWRKSSIYPFALLRSQILQNPLFMLGILWDTNNYLPSSGYNQFKYQNTYNGTISQVSLNSVDANERVHSILNYSIEYMCRNGQDPSTLRDYINNSTVQLMYPLSGYSDPNNITAYGSPNDPSDAGAAELIPTQDYSLFLNQSTPTGTINYSGLIITTSDNGYKISGYNKFNPYFTIYAANNLGPYTKIAISSNTYKYPTSFASYSTAIPYNTIFPTVQDVINFIAGYENFLTTNGISFTITNNISQTNWYNATIQFIKWSLTNFNSDVSLSIILNPGASIIQYTSSSGTLDDLTNPLVSLLLDTNGTYIDSKYLDVFREANNITITHQGGGVFSCLNADIIDFEHRLIFDNTTAFNDTIYDPLTGIRQNRISLSGQKSANWNGTLDSPGFLICTNSVDSWEPNTDYLVGSLVNWKNSNYVAQQNIIGSSAFPYTQFKKISTVFQNKILPNLALKSVDYINSYNTNYRPFITDLVNLRNETIGYIERDWLSGLDIDETSQMNFYRGWLKEKGTTNALDSYAQGASNNFGTITKINEEYALKVGIYGSDTSTGYGDVSLPSNYSNINPIVVSFVSTIDTNDSNSIQITPKSLYEKSSNWKNNFASYVDANIEIDSSNFLSAGPVIPQNLIALNRQTVKDFSKDDEDYLYFDDLNAMIKSSQQNILKIGKQGGVFWLKNHHTTSKENAWDVITFIPQNTYISSIQSLNANNVSILITANISVVANDAVLIDYTDVGSNISIQGTFKVNNYIVSPTILGNVTSYGNLIIETTENQFGNISLNYANPVITSGIYSVRSLRQNSIAEGNFISTDASKYVVNDNEGEAAYSLVQPYNQKITYADTYQGVAISSMSYDSNNQILWSGKPDYVPNGVVEFRLVGTTIENGNTLPTIDTSVSILQPQNPSTFNLGSVVSCANAYCAASAGTLNGPGQVYICQYTLNSSPQIVQIQNPNNSSPFQVTNMTMSGDGRWLYAIEKSSGETPLIDVYALQKNWSSTTYNITDIVSNTSITVNQTISDPQSIKIQIINNTNYSSRILIPGLEYNTNGTQIAIDQTTAGTTYIGDSNYSISITALDYYFAYQGSIDPSKFGISLSSGDNFGAAISTDNLGETIAIGAPGLDQGEVFIFSRIIENQYLTSQTNTITPVNSFSTITRLQINGVDVEPTLTSANPISAGSTIEIEGFCFTFQQNILPPTNFDQRFGQSVSIQNNQLMVGSPATLIGSQYRKGMAYYYALDSSITNTKIIPIVNLNLNENPFMINNWVVSPQSSTINDLITAINNMTRYTGVSASVSGVNLILEINSEFHTNGITLAEIS
ncbi:FG-GAP repeat protein [uncultured archaeon]|nr:FG-GAP repeat protein [uncultured archaeon]